jgi:hypothetical protein
MLVVACLAVTLDAGATMPRKYHPHEILAITWVAEAGWDNHDDHIAMGHVLLRRKVRGQSLSSIARQYSQGLWNRKRGRSAWLRGMYADCRVPDDWPHKAKLWQSYKRKCEQIMKTAKAFMRNPRSFADPCEGEPVHFGGPMDQPSSKLMQVECRDGMVQRYYRRLEKDETL